MFITFLSEFDKKYHILAHKLVNNSYLCLTLIKPQMKSSELFRKLKKDGWYVVSSEGSHYKMVHPVKEGTIVFPYHGAKEMGVGLEKAIKKQAGI